MKNKNEMTPLNINCITEKQQFINELKIGQEEHSLHTGDVHTSIYFYFFTEVTLQSVFQEI